MIIHKTNEAIAAHRARITIPWPGCVFKTDGKVNRSNSKAFAAAINSIRIFVQKTGSLARVVAFVMKRNTPEGTTASNPLLDHRSRNRPSKSTGRIVPIPSKRKSNIKAGPTTSTIPIICTISSAGYNQLDCRIAAAKLLSSSH